MFNGEGILVLFVLLFWFFLVFWGGGLLGELWFAEVDLGERELARMYVQGSAVTEFDKLLGRC